MGINVFGQVIKAPRISRAALGRELLLEVAKRGGERDILGGFISGQSYAGVQRFSELQQYSKDVVDRIAGGTNQENGFNKQPVIDFYIAEMKRQKVSDGTSVYLDLVYCLIENSNSSYRLPLRKLRCGRIEVTDLPKTFPTHFKKAECLLYGKLAGELGEDEVKEYLVRNKLLEQLRLVAKDLFFGVNNGLSGEKLTNFLSLMYELRKMQTTNPTNEGQLRKNILNSFLYGQPLELIHIKCLRFIYPYGRTVELVEHLDDVEVPTKDGGIHQPPSERNIVSRLKDFVSMAEAHGLVVDFKVLLSDQDIIDYFPDDGCSFISADEVCCLKRPMVKYKTKIEESLKGVGEAHYLRSYLDEIGQLVDFDETRQRIIEELRRGGERLPEAFVEEAVDYRTASNEKILSDNPGRNFARDRVYAQLGSMQALEVLGKDENGYRKNIILIEEDRGNQNQFIGGCRKTALPVYFMKLRDTF